MPVPILRTKLLISFTLTPMLAARWLRDETKTRRQPKGQRPLPQLNSFLTSRRLRLSSEFDITRGLTSCFESAIQNQKWLNYRSDDVLTTTLRLSHP